MSYPVSEGGPAGLRLTPGRIAALVIGVPVALSVIVFTSFSIVSSLGTASFQVADNSIPVQNGKLTVRTSGNVTLKQVAAAQAAKLTGTVRYSLVRPNVTVTGNVVSLDCRYTLGNCSLNSTLDVPSATTVTLSTGGGDLSVENFTSDLMLNTDGGNVDAGNLSGKDLKMQTGGGDVNVNTLDAAGQLQLTTDGGNINVPDMTSPSPTVESGGGDVSLTFTKVMPDSLTIITDGGNVDLTVPSGQYAIVTNPDGGNVNSVPSRQSSKHYINVQSGGGDINITGPN